MGIFKINSKFKPMGDQPKAIDQLVDSINNGNKFQTLLGVTGSGKTFTMANIIERVQRPALILAHNKILAAQLCSEFREFFPNNAIEYFVSYYDYYQPEAYVPHTDTFIEKDASINQEIDKLRHSATSSLIERRDTIVVSSVSCIYGLGNPNEYKNLVINLRVGMIKDRDEVVKKLVEIQYERNEMDFARGSFRVKGDVLDVVPASTFNVGVRVEFFGDEIDKINEFDILTGKTISSLTHISIYPASHFATSKDRVENAISEINCELKERVKYFKENEKLIEAQRIKERTNYDIEMLREMGYCNGIENYSRIMDGRKKGSMPYTLFDYFPDDYLIFIDESHATIPQIKAMYAGDKSRKDSLVEYGFRLPCAYDNRPLKFEEFESKINQMIFVSATPSDYEKEHQEVVGEQIIRPTGLLDPIVEVRPVGSQVDDLYGEIIKSIEKGNRVLVTTLTKKMAENLTDYLNGLNIKTTYMHSDVKTIDRMQIIRDLRIGEFDVLIGINLLREGLDIPEVSLVAILDADKEGFLRSETSLIQTIGRAARNSESKVIMYADVITKSMKKAIDETKRRRDIQIEYNKKNNIVPKTVVKDIREVIQATKIYNEEKKMFPNIEIPEDFKERAKLITNLEKEMKEHAKNLDFEKAMEIRDFVKKIRNMF